MTQARQTRGEPRGVDRARERRKHERVRVVLEAKVVARSIGSPVTYDFVTRDISVGGVFIGGKGKDYPFKNETMLEIWLGLRLQPELVVSFLGKIAHSSGGGFGIKIVQIEDKEQKALNDFIQELIEGGAEVVPPFEPKDS